MSGPGRWLVFGASVRGPAHIADGTPCQDAWASVASGDVGTIVCVCDGAGSASHADLGAMTATAAVVDVLRARPPSDPDAMEAALRAACDAGRDAIFAEAAARDLAPDALACTLVLAATFGARLGIAHVGDGAVVARRRGSLFVPSAPDRGEYAGETWFLTSPSWRDRLRVGVHDDIDAFCAFTDGCQHASLVMGPAIEPYLPFCEPLFAFADEADDIASASAEVAALLECEALRRSSGDDKTLAVARLRP